MTRPLPWLMALSLLVGIVVGWMVRPSAEPVVAEVHVHSGEAEIERLQHEVEDLRRRLGKARAGKAALEVEAHGAPEAVAQTADQGPVEP